MRQGKRASAKAALCPRVHANDNIAEAQWPSVKAAVANKQIQSRAHIAATIGKAFESGEIAPSPRTCTRG